MIAIAAVKKPRAWIEALGDVAAVVAMSLCGVCAGVLMHWA